MNVNDQGARKMRRQIGPESESSTSSSGTATPVSVSANDSPSSSSLAPVFRQLPKRVVQKDVDQKVMTFLIKRRQPFAVVDSTEFRGLVLLGIQKI